MSRVVRWVRLAYLGLLVSSLLLFCGCAFLFNQAPTAVIKASVVSGHSPLTVNFSSADSTDPDGEIASVEWDFGDGESTTDAAPHHTFVAFTTVKVFTVTLRVKDDGGATDETSQMIEVMPQQPGGGEPGQPIARIKVNRFIGASPVTVSFDGSTSTPGTGTIATYHWDFGDNTTATGSFVSRTFSPDETKEYTATLTVWNSGGVSAFAQVKIIVIVPESVSSGDEPVADFSMSDPLLLYASDNPQTKASLFEVSFDPRSSYPDTGRSIEYYAWDFGDGVTLVETSDLEVTHVYSLLGASRTYIVRLLVYDDQGREGVKIVNLTLTQPED